jgi:hypothetical protein
VVRGEPRGLRVRPGPQRPPGESHRARVVVTATLDSIRTGRTARCFKDFTYATLDSWSRERRVIGKAEVTGGEANPRFIVTSLTRGEVAARHLYEKIYCARGDMEISPA